MSSNISPSGLVTNPETGERFVPSSARPDGTIRKELRVKPGYKPKEDIERYKPPGARSIIQKSEKQGEPAPAKGSSSHNSKAEAGGTSTGDETFKESKIPQQTVETDKSEPTSTSSNADDEKSNFVMVHKANLKQFDTTRNPVEAADTCDESFVTITKNTKNQGIPLRAKKSTMTSATTSKNMESNKWNVLASADELFRTGVGSAAKKTAAHRAKRASKKKNAMQGEKDKDKDEKDKDKDEKDKDKTDEKKNDEDKDEKDKDEKDKIEKDKIEKDKAEKKEDSLTKESPEKEVIPEKIPNLLEMREMVRTLPTMASLGFRLPKTHKSRKANTCHTSYHTQPRSAERKISWKVVPDPEQAEQWFDAETTLEDQV